MPYTVIIKRSALRAISMVPASDALRIERAIEALAENPRPHGVKKLQGPQGLYRIRVGDYRVIYEIADRVLIVTVVRVGHRREVYRT